MLLGVTLERQDFKKFSKLCNRGSKNLSKQEEIQWNIKGREYLGKGRVREKTSKGRRRLIRKKKKIEERQSKRRRKNEDLVAMTAIITTIITSTNIQSAPLAPIYNQHH